MGVQMPSSRKRAAHLVAVDAGQQDVEDDGVVGALAGAPEAVVAVVGDVDVESLGGEAVGDGRGEELFVLDDQDSHTRIVPVRACGSGDSPQVPLRGRRSG